MAVREILQLGNPTLRMKCTTVKSFGDDHVQSVAADLLDTLSDFRSRRGFGRGIAAPQIGVSERIVVLHTDQPLVLVNPVILRRSRRHMTLWDDCFCFPDILARVRRSLSVEVRYQDENGRRHTLKAGGGLSELLQHEIDHLDGILAVDRAIDSKHIVFRTEYEKWGKGKAIAL